MGVDIQFFGIVELVDFFEDLLANAGVAEGQDQVVFLFRENLSSAVH